MKKNAIPILGHFSIAIVLAIVLFSCKKSTNDAPQTDNKKQGSVYEYIKKLGYKDSEIKDIGDQYLVDGDVLFDKNSQPDFSIFGGPRTEQYGTANYVGYHLQPFCRIQIESSMSAYTNEINDAIALWNNIPNCRLKFSTTVLSPIRIRIRMADLVPGLCGVGYFPINGQPGEQVVLGSDWLPLLPYNQRVSLIAHELGHTIGFRHTNGGPGEPSQGQDPHNGAYFDAMHILGTPTSGDPNSIMNGSTCGSMPTTLSAFDIVAMQFLYPANAPAAGTVPVFRYYSRITGQDHLYTTNFGELGNGNNNDYIFEGIGFFAFPNQVANSVPVHRYFLPQGGYDHFYTANPNEIPSPANYEGVAFYAYTSPINGAVPVYRYWNGSLQDHFYTKNPNELNLMPNYVSEGIGWYAY